MPQAAARFFTARGEKDLAPWTQSIGENVVQAIFAPLPTLAKAGGEGRPSRFTKPPPSKGSNAHMYRRKTLPYISPRSPLVASSLADLSPGVMFTDGASFTGTSRLRILGRYDALANPTILPGLGKANAKQSEPAAVEDPVIDVASPPVDEEEEQRKRLRRSSEEKLIEQVGMGNHDVPGEGIFASPSMMAAPKSWESAKNSLMKQVSKTRRASYGELIDQATAAITTADVGDEKGLKVPAAKVLQIISAIPWFRRLSNTEVRKLLSRAETVFVHKGDVMLRENSYGSAFYVLLEGRVCCRSDSRHIDVALTPGTCFGESALATQVHVRREATVTALEDSWCLKMTAKDMADLKNVDLETLKKIYHAKLLMKVRWFDMLTPTKLEALGRMMQIETFPASRVVFSEGDVGDKMYILVSGAVGLFKLKGGNSAGASPNNLRASQAGSAPAPDAPEPSPMRPPPQGTKVLPSAYSGAVDFGAASSPADAGDADPLRDSWASRNVLLAECNMQAKNPWFGETALFNDGRPRGATAFTLEQTQLLSVHCSQTNKLKEIIPEFFRMNLAYSTVYKKVNQLNGTEQSNLDLSDGPKLKSRTLIGDGGEPIGTSVVAIG